MSNEDMTSRAKDQPGGQVEPRGERAMGELARRAERAALCLEAWSEGRGPHANVRDVSGALAKTVRALMFELYGPLSQTDLGGSGKSEG